MTLLQRLLFIILARICSRTYSAVNFSYFGAERKNLLRLRAFQIRVLKNIRIKLRNRCSHSEQALHESHEIYRVDTF